MKNMVINYLRKYLSFSKTEINGSFVLIIILIVIIFFPFDIFNPEIDLEGKIARKQLTYFLNFPEEPPRTKFYKHSINHFSNFKKDSTQDTIRKKKDSLLFKKDTLKKTFYKKTTLNPVDINHCNEWEIQKIRGIGPSLSARIIKYRDNLGGFINLEQLSDIFGIDSTRFEELKKYVYVSKDFNPKKLKINTDSLETLNIHPYISYKEASIIVNYRKQHGDFKELEELKKIRILDEEKFLKLLPYIEIK